MNNSCSINCTNKKLIKESQKDIKKFDSIIDTVDFFKLLGNTTRIKILLILIKNELCVCDIAESISLSIPATSQQLKSLRTANLLKQRNEGKTVYYSYKSDETKDKIKNLILNFQKL